MKVKVNINAQLWYNAAWYEGGEAWKPKGDTTFQIDEVDSDDLFYADKEVLMKTFQELLDKQSTNVERFEYIDYSIQADEPTVIAGVDFEDSLNKMLNLGL
jgi:hypothetical protein